MGRRADVIFAVALITLLAACQWGLTGASDPELTTDFFVPPGKDKASLDGNFFTFTGLRGGVGVSPGQFNSTRVSVEEFPALEGLGLSAMLMYFKPGGLNPPHTHPRATKLLYVIQGTLTVGFVDTTNKLFNQTLVEGDMFVVPKGMAHYMVNLDESVDVKVIFSFSSSNPGTWYIGNGLFGSPPGIPDDILAKSFGVSAETVSSLRAPYQPHN